MVRSLYTSREVSEIRGLLHDRQNSICPILGESLDIKDSVCDHDHQTQHVRAALHRQSNAFEGLVFNAYKRCLEWVTDKPLPELLRNLATYLEQDYSGNPYHTGWQKKIQTLFNALKEKQKDDVLCALGYDKQTNGLARKKVFRKAVLSRKFGYLELKSIIESSKSSDLVRIEKEKENV